MYQAGEFIVYGTNSVCRVESIGKPPFETEEDKLYYTLVPVVLHADARYGHGDHLYSDGFAGVYPSGDLPRKSRGTHQLYS